MAKSTSETEAETDYPHWHPTITFLLPAPWLRNSLTGLSRRGYLQKSTVLMKRNISNLIFGRKTANQFALGYNGKINFLLVDSGLLDQFHRDGSPSIKPTAMFVSIKYPCPAISANPRAFVRPHPLIL